MGTWLRSIVDAFPGKVPGNTSRLDTATRMAMDADFSKPSTRLWEPIRKGDLVAKIEQNHTGGS
jgi:hypothetical protein